MEQIEPPLNWLTRLKKGLKDSSQKLTQGIESILTHKTLTQDMLTDLEDLLISADLGVQTAQKLTDLLRKKRFKDDISFEAVQSFLAEEITRLLNPLAQPLQINANTKPYTILVVGVNGSGKTTTTAKWGHLFQQKGKKVRFAACDTFRAAATEQLALWAERFQIPIEKGAHGADPASLAYEAYLKAHNAQEDVLLIDTAGRLHTKHDLMAELNKIYRVLQKADPTAPHACALILDATTGQNIHNQVSAFQKTVPLTGLVLTKLDGTAKGGILVALAEKETPPLPVYAVGVGEQPDDLQDFNPEAFSRSLLGISDKNVP